MSAHKLPQYRIFLLRCWKEQGRHAAAGWRFAIEDGQTHARHGFADLESLTAFLQHQLEGDTQADEGEEEE